MKKYLCIAAAAVLFTSGCGSPKSDTAPEVSPAPVEISCCISPELSGVLNDIYKKYDEDHPGLIVTFNADSPQKLEDGIRNGNDCDIIFSISEESIKSLDESGYIIPDSANAMICDSAVIITSADNNKKISGFKDLPKAKTAAVAPANTSLGKYSYNLIDKCAISPKIKEYATTDEIIQAVSDGSCDVGIIYATDVAAAKDKVKTVTDAVADSSVLTDEYTAALVNNSTASAEQQSAAKAFFKYLSSNAARNSFIYYGFTMK